MKKDNINEKINYIPRCIDINIKRNPYLGCTCPNCPAGMIVENYSKLPKRVVCDNCWQFYDARTGTPIND